jgi:hypothetical protein
MAPNLRLLLAYLLKPLVFWEVGFSHGHFRLGEEPLLPERIARSPVQYLLG